MIADTRLVPAGALTYPDTINYTTAQQWLAVYRGMQDARGAIRSIIKMQLDGVNSSLYQFDTSKLFLGGTSAGSVLALAATFYKTQAKINDVFPGISTSLGPADLQDVYYANPADVDYFGKIKGVLNCWGSLATPATAGFLFRPLFFL